MNLEVTSLSINKIGVKPRSHFGKAIKQDIMGQRHKIQKDMDSVKKKFNKFKTGLAKYSEKLDKEASIHQIRDRQDVTEVSDFNVCMSTARNNKQYLLHTNEDKENADPNQTINIIGLMGTAKNFKTSPGTSKPQTSYRQKSHRTQQTINRTIDLSREIGVENGIQPARQSLQRGKSLRHSFPRQHSNNSLLASVSSQKLGSSYCVTKLALLIPQDNTEQSMRRLTSLMSKEGIFVVAIDK